MTYFGDELGMPAADEAENMQPCPHSQPLFHTVWLRRPPLTAAALPHYAPSTGSWRKRNSSWCPTVGAPDSPWSCDWPDRDTFSRRDPPDDEDDLNDMRNSNSPYGACVGAWHVLSWLSVRVR